MKKALSFVLSLLVVICSVSITASAHSAVLIKAPDQTSFYQGRDWIFNDGKILPLSDFNASGTVVEVDGKKISYQTFAWGGNMWIAPKNGREWKSGVNTAVIYLDDYDDSVFVETNINLVEITKTETVSQPKTNTLVNGIHWHYDRYGFIALDSLDLTGTAIKVHYADSTSQIIEHSKENPLKWQVPYEMDDFTLGQNRLELDYEGHISTFTVTFVEKLITTVLINNEPDKTVYAFGDDWSYDANDRVKLSIDLSGLSVKIFYAGGKNEIVSYDTCPEKFSYDKTSSVRKGASTFEITYDGKHTFDCPIVVEAYGDVDLNGFINSQDALYILQCVTAKKSFVNNQKKYADVDLSGKINSSDALFVLQHTTGYINKFKAEIKGG